MTDGLNLPPPAIPDFTNTFRVVAKQELAKRTICMMEIEAPFIARKAKAGQFVILRVTDTGERIPMTITDKDPEKGTITIYFQIIGKSTALMRTLRVGECFQDVVGPLGEPDRIERVGKIVMVGGGTGTAVLYHITKAYRDFDNYIIGITGAREKELLILEKEMRQLCDELMVCTDDGSQGERGLVTDLLTKCLRLNPDVRMVWGIGPLAMMKAVANLTRPLQIKTMVSLNPIMLDGTGMCGCCRVTVNRATRFVCVHGPSFDAHQVDFDELLKRKGMYLVQERESLLFSVRR